MREPRRDRYPAELRLLAGTEGLNAGNVAPLTDEMRRRLAEWQRFPTANVAQTRQILR
jgi:hypothetical protein